MAKSKIIVPVECIENKIFFIRKEKVMLGNHLAKLYGVETRSLNQAVKRNIACFPDDFMFQLNDGEIEMLVSQNVIPHKKYFGGAKPYAFTEQGVAMLASVLNSERAIQVNIAIMRTFVRIRQILTTHKELTERLKHLESRMDKHDEEIETIFEAIQRLIEPPTTTKHKIGFLVEEPKGNYRIWRR